MMIRRLAVARPSSRVLRNSTQTISRPFILQQKRWESNAQVQDPDMTGGYEMPSRVIRQHRDPYEDWWDKQERRNFGEPMHEDEDVLGMFTPEDYNFYTTPQALGLMGCFGLAFAALFAVVAKTYPDRPAVDRGFPGGLDRELGGPGAVLARAEDGLD